MVRRCWTTASSFTACRLVSAFIILSCTTVWCSTIAAATSSDGSMIIRSEEEVRLLFMGWQVKYGRSYEDPEEEQRRFEIFRDNLRFIDEHNRPKNKRSFTVGLNSFADLSLEEYQSMYLMNSLRNHLDVAFRDRDSVISDLNLPMEQIPTSVDWRQNGAVGPVKDQGPCGSCWVFAAIATVEGINAIVSRRPVTTLSEQEIIDCSDNPTPCNGGWMSVAYDYIIRNGGIDTDVHYLYKRRREQCWADRKKVANINGYAYGKKNREDDMITLVARQPIAVAIDASGQDFQLYKTGVFDGACGVALNHAVTVAGYGSQDGKDYWLVKNSWNYTWGDDGYIKMRRNIDDARGKCGIAMWPIYPTKLQSEHPTASF